MIAAAEGEPVRLRLDLAYDGTAFSGWARQPDRRTVQQTVEDALALILRIPAARLTVAGRTDAGVHARGQVCHVDLDRPVVDNLPPDQLRRRLARLLPDDVICRQISCAPAGFDARFSALARHYTYRINDGRADRDPLRRHQVLWWPRTLQVEAMDAAAQQLLGEHDFAAFCKPREGATTIRTLNELSCVRAGESDLDLGPEGEVVCRVAADAFCHSMVRALVGSLIVVGESRQPPAWPGEVLRRGVRNSRVPVVPPQGLTLEQVDYPDDSTLAQRAAEARAVRELG